MIGKIISVLCVLITGFISLAPTAQSAEVKIMTIPVTEQIYMITGKGGNIGLFIGEDGTFLIDDQFAPLTEKIVAAINTHYHGDHTGGNENLGQGGTLIFSHDNVRERLSTGSFIEAFNMKREAVSREGLPVVTFSEDISFHLTPIPMVTALSILRKPMLSTLATYFSMVSIHLSMLPMGVPSRE
jgi:hypothetical protein